MAQRKVVVHNQGTSLVTLKDPETKNVYRLGDYKGTKNGLIKHPTSASIDADEWARIVKLKGTQRLLSDASPTRPSTLRVG